MSRLPAVDAVVEAGVAEGVAPGMSAVVIAAGELVHAGFQGRAQIEPEPAALTAEHLFDVASLTKVMATTTLAAVLVREGALDLEAPVARVLPAFVRAGKEAVTVRHLLAHESGLPAWRPYFEQVRRDPVGSHAFLPPERRDPGRLAAAFARGRLLVEEAVMSERLEVPPGTRALYSDVGFLALGWCLERIGGAGLDRLCAARVFEPLALASTLYLGGRPPPGRPFVATERCEHRGEVNCGAVNDDNAWAMGGVAGHAGLFSSARDVALLGQAWLEALRGNPSLVDPEVAGRFARRRGSAGGTRALGWDTPSAADSQLGSRLGRGRLGAIGHLGFTGTSLWVDLDEEVVVALLTNRCHPSRDNERIKAFRPTFHDTVARALGI